MKSRRVPRWRAIQSLIVGSILCIDFAASGQQVPAIAASQINGTSPASSSSTVGNVPGATASAPSGPNVAPVSEVTTANTSPASSPIGAPNPAATTTSTVERPRSAANVVCPDLSWVPQEKGTHLPLTGDLYIRGSANSVTADIITDARVLVKVGDRLTKEANLEAGRPTRITFDSSDKYWTETGVLLPVALSVKAPADWPSDCRLLSFTVNVALNKVHFAISGAPAGLGCEKPCDVVSPRKSRPVWGEKIGLEVSLKQDAADTSLPGDVTIGLEGDEVTGRRAYSLRGYAPLSNLHFELVPQWRFIAVSPRPLAIRLDIGLGTDAATGKPLQGFTTPLTLESVPPWWARLPAWLVGALLWSVLSMGPLVRKADTPRMGGWRVTGAIVSAALIFSCVEAGANSLPKAVEDVPYSLWGSFLLGFACAMAGVTLVMKYVAKAVTGGILDIKPEEATQDRKPADTSSESPKVDKSARGPSTNVSATDAPAMRLIDLPPIAGKTRLYICLHEAGHCLATYEYGGHVESIDFPKNGDPYASVVRSPEVSRHIACGGFAVEYLLFTAGKITDARGTPISESAFISAAIDNAVTLPPETVSLAE